MDAWIAALSAILGTSVGGLITYLTTKAANKNAAAIESRRIIREDARDTRRLAAQFVSECTSIVEAYDSNFKVSSPQHPLDPWDRRQVEGEPVTHAAMIAAYWEVRLQLADASVKAAKDLHDETRVFTLTSTYFVPGVEIELPDDQEWDDMHKAQAEAANAFIEAVRRETQQLMERGDRTGIPV